MATIDVKKIDSDTWICKIDGKAVAKIEKKRETLSSDHYGSYVGDVYDYLYWDDEVNRFCGVDDNSEASLKLAVVQAIRVYTDNNNINLGDTNPRCEEERVYNTEDGLLSYRDMFDKGEQELREVRRECEEHMKESRRKGEERDK